MEGKEIFKLTRLVSYEKSNSKSHKNALGIMFELLDQLEVQKCC